MPINYPGWWAAGMAANVEAWIAANAGQFPANTTLFHGTNTVAFFNQVTGFSGSEQAWVNAFFQSDLGGNAHAGAGIYGGDTLAVAQGYGAHVMRTIPTTLARSRYIDVRNGFRPAALPNGVNLQDVLRHGYRCILRYTVNYYAVKDFRVEWEPN